MTVRIRVREVGQKFACAARVYHCKTGRKLHETREFPYGFDDQAYRAALRWAQDMGFTVVEEA